VTVLRHGEAVGERRRVFGTARTPSPPAKYLSRFFDTLFKIGNGRVA
jgi:hypothetical protein